MTLFYLMTQHKDGMIQGQARLPPIPNTCIHVRKHKCIPGKTGMKSETAWMCSRGNVETVTDAQKGACSVDSGI